MSNLLNLKVSTSNNKVFRLRWTPTNEGLSVLNANISESLQDPDLSDEADNFFDLGDSHEKKFQVPVVFAITLSKEREMADTYGLGIHDKSWRAFAALYTAGEMMVSFDEGPDRELHVQLGWVTGGSRQEAKVRALNLMSAIHFKKMPEDTFCGLNHADFDVTPPQIRMDISLDLIFGRSLELGMPRSGGGHAVVRIDNIREGEDSPVEVVGSTFSFLTRIMGVVRAVTGWFDAAVMIASEFVLFLCYIMQMLAILGTVLLCTMMDVRAKEGSSAENVIWWTVKRTSQFNSANQKARFVRGNWISSAILGVPRWLYIVLILGVIGLLTSTNTVISLVAVSLVSSVVLASVAVRAWLVYRFEYFTGSKPIGFTMIETARLLHSLNKCSEVPKQQQRLAVAEQAVFAKPITGALRKFLISFQW